jgi:hypothetical protein
LSSDIFAHIAADWDGFAEIRSTARAFSQKGRLTHALSIATNEVRQGDCILECWPYGPVGKRALA